LDMIGNTTCEKACSVLKGQHWGLKAVDALSSFHPLDTVSYLWDSLSQHPTSLYGGYFINNSSYNPEQTREFWNSAVYCQNAHTRNTTEFLRYICWVKNERRHNVVIFYYAEEKLLFQRQTLKLKSYLSQQKFQIRWIKVYKEWLRILIWFNNCHCYHLLYKWI
jgi:hypothetical protein